MTTVSHDLYFACRKTFEHNNHHDLATKDRKTCFFDIASAMGGHGFFFFFLPSSFRFMRSYYMAFSCLSLICSFFLPCFGTNVSFLYLLVLYIFYLGIFSSLSFDSYCFCPKHRYPIQACSILFFSCPFYSILFFHCPSI